MLVHCNSLQFENSECQIKQLQIMIKKRSDTPNKKHFKVMLHPLYFKEITLILDK